MDDLANLYNVFTPKKPEDGLSHVERLLNRFEAHESEEEHALEEYKKFLDGIKEPATRFVLQMILSDEEKHRAVVHAMIATLRGSLNWTQPPGSLEGEGSEAIDSKRLLDVTEKFIELEKSGIKEYKALLGESTNYYQGLFNILINSMIRDSEKHIELLEFLEQRLRGK
jgi:bacterioferritin (cytochrome b1)